MKTPNMEVSTSSLKLFGFQVSMNENEPQSSSLSGSPETGDIKMLIEGRKFDCRYCGKEFGNSQALGGHQNAHKKQRQQLKQAQMHVSQAPTMYRIPPGGFLSPHAARMPVQYKNIESYMPMVIPAGHHALRSVCTTPLRGFAGHATWEGFPSMECHRSNSSGETSPTFVSSEERVLAVQSPCSSSPSLSKFSNEVCDKEGLDLHLRLAPCAP